MAAREIAWDLVKIGRYDVLVWVHTEVDPPAAEWDPAIAEISKSIASLDVARMRVFVVSDGGAPNAKQRMQIQKETLRGKALPTSVVTTALSNPLKRGVATALRWLNPAYAFFEPHEIRRAVTHLDLQDDLPGLWLVLGKLQARLRANDTLRLMAHALDLAPLSTRAAPLK